METKTSCTPQEPLSKLEESGTASILNYNLPQATSYEVVSFLKLDIPATIFKKTEKTVPKDNFWQQLGTTTDLGTIKSILSGKQYSSINAIQDLSINLNSTSRITNTGITIKAANIPVSTQSFEFSQNLIANKIAEGQMPVLYKRFSGKQGLRFIKEPATPDPAIYMVMRLRMSSYLGDYGAGQTIKTFSLLPGEKTTISIRTYEQEIETSTSSESILDSYSESCSDDLQTTIETKAQQTLSMSETDTDSMSGSIGFEAGGSVDLGIVSVGGETTASGSASSVNTTTQALGIQMDVLNSSVDHHVQTADTSRQIEINTETSSTSTEETEVTTTRTLENINKSRVLNFVFRQLLQEYFTITYLYDVSFHYYNGYPTSKKSGTLANLAGFLNEILGSAEDAETVRNKIYEHLCNIVDYTGTKVSLIESVSQTSENCIVRGSEAIKTSYVRIRDGLQYIYEGRTVKGIILNVTHRIVRTPSVIVDAVLGQGESLDCYNMQLQEAAYVAAQLENDKSQQMIDVVNGVTDPIERAKLYKKVFTDCCDVPQSCCCCNGSTTSTE